MSIKKLIPLCFIFLLLVIPSAYAYEPTLINVSYTGSGGSLRCTNLSGTAYCYIFGSSKIERWQINLTMNNSCNYGYSAPSPGAAIINASAAWAGGPNFFMYNLSNFSTSTCQGIDGPHDLGIIASYSDRSKGIGYDNQYIYWPYNKTTHVGTIKGNINSTWFADGYWGSFTDMAMPNMSDNSTVFFRNSTGWGSDQRIYRYYNGLPLTSYPSLTDIYGLPGEAYNWDMLKENDGFYYIYFNSYGRFYKANFSALDNSSYIDCDYPTYNGTYCDSMTSYTTVVGCTNTTSTCPSGTFCQQLTPQINVTSDLIENYTECKLYYKIGGWTPCSNLCFGHTSIWSNCWDYPSNSSGCEQCPYTDAIYGYASSGVYSNTWYSNQTTVSVPSYTIACINQSTMGIQFVIDNNGKNTTEVGILTVAGNNVTNATTLGGVPQNTTTECYDSSGNPVACYSGTDNVSGLKAYLNNGLGTSFGGEIMSLIMSVMISMAVFLKTKSKQIEAFMLPFMVCLAAFALVGLFPVWFLLLQTAAVGVLIFQRVRG